MQRLNVIYEDNHIIVVEKIVNVPSQSDKTGDTDMLSMVKNYIKEKIQQTRKCIYRACTPLRQTSWRSNGICKNI